MNELTDFGWFLYGADQPSPDLNNLSFSNGIFSATTGPSPNVFLLETGNPYAARLGKTGTNHPIDANTYRMVAMRVNIDASTSGSFYWNRDHLWDGNISISGTFGLTPGWRTYLVDLPTLGLRGGTIQWNGIIRSLQFSPSAVDQHQLQIDWIRLVNLDSSLCRRVTWSGFAGAVDLYLDTDGVQNGNETMLAPGATNNTASLGCSPARFRLQLLRRGARTRHVSGACASRRIVAAFVAVPNRVPGKRGANAIDHRPFRGRQCRRLRNDPAWKSLGHECSHRRRAIFRCDKSYHHDIADGNAGWGLPGKHPSALWGECPCSTAPRRRPDCTAGLASWNADRSNALPHSDS